MQLVRPVGTIVDEYIFVGECLFTYDDIHQLIKFHFNIRREIGGESSVCVGELEGIGGGVPMVGDYLESYIRKETAITKVGGGLYV